MLRVRDFSMPVHRLVILVVAAASMVSAPAVAQQLPAGGVFVEGRNGLMPGRYSHRVCQPERRQHRFRCILGTGEWGQLTFTYRVLDDGRTTDGCTFRVSQTGGFPRPDHFSIVRVRDEFRRPCVTNSRGRVIEVFPTH
jgi:hypothetical protein